MSATVDVNKAIGQLTRYADGVRRDTNKLIAKTATQVESKAKRNVPVDTGRLRSSIHATFTGTPRAPSATVGTEVNYAPYVEFGTGAFASEYLSSKSQELRQYAMTFYKTGKGRMPAQPFLFPAWEEVRPEFEKELIRLLQDPRSKISKAPSGRGLDALDLFVLGPVVSNQAVQTTLFVT